MNTRPRSPLHAADALRRAHLAMGEAIVALRRISLRDEERGENRHRLRLADAQVYEARYHLAAARSVHAVGLTLEEPVWVPRLLETVAQVGAARRNIARLRRVRAGVAEELDLVARRAHEPSLARLEELPRERLPLPAAEGLLYGGVMAILGGIAGLLAGLEVLGAFGIVVGFIGWTLAAEALGSRRP